MRSLLSKQRIRSKLIIMCTMVAVSALLVACITFWIYESVVYLQTLRQESLTIARMLADSSAAALTFHDRVAAQDTAATLRAEPRVVQACVYDADGTVLATYSRSNNPVKCPSANLEKTIQLGRHNLLITQPVAYKTYVAGSLFLEVDLKEMYRMWTRYGIISTVILCVATLFAMALSSRLQRSISTPILHLSQVTSEVSENGDYSLRASKSSDDEIGQLIDMFNSMMEVIRTAQNELERRVEERTDSLVKEIAERKAVEYSLVNAKLAAEAANTAKSSFLANMSHELRTPLNAILGYSEMLLEDAMDSGDSAAAQDLDRILFAGKHLLELINDVLDISKIEAGALQLHLESAHTDQITRDVIATIEPLAQKNNNRFDVRMTEGGFVKVDTMKLRQCLLNLLSNACKFTENGIVTLAVERVSLESKIFVCWRVHDTGVGIAPEDIKRLFQPFTQVDSSATRRHGGTGLGLAISHRLCKMMGGNISLVSELGVGSTFTISLPIEGSDVVEQQ